MDFLGKKSVTFLLVLLAGFSLAFSQNILSEVEQGKFSLERPWFEHGLSQSVFAAGTANTGTSFEPYSYALQGGYNIEASTFSATAALQLAKETVQLTSQGVWYPVHFGLLRVGLGGGFNLFFDSTYAFEFNLFPGAYLEFRPRSWFMFSTHINYLLKVRAIYSVVDQIGALCNNTATLGLRATFFVPGGFAFYIGGDSCELFRHMILGVPSFTLGASYSLEKLYFLLEINVRYIDFFTASATYEGTEIRALVGYRL
mgnify:CR=1 FL=1